METNPTQPPPQPAAEESAEDAVHRIEKKHTHCGGSRVVTNYKAAFMELALELEDRRATLRPSPVATAESELSGDRHDGAVSLTESLASPAKSARMDYRGLDVGLRPRPAQFIPPVAPDEADVIAGKIVVHFNAGFTYELGSAGITSAKWLIAKWIRAAMTAANQPESKV